MKGIAVAGNILLDKIKIIDTYPERNMLTNILSVSEAVGGCVPNTAIDLKVIDPALPVYAIGKVGEDREGRFVTGEMKRYGVDVCGVKADPAYPTSFTDVMTERKGGARTFFHLKGANAALSLADFDVEKLDCDIFHIGYLLLLDRLDEKHPEFGTQLAYLLKRVRERGIKTSIDVVSEQSDRFKTIVLPALKYCDYVIVNEVEGGRIAGLSPRDERGAIDCAAVKKILQSITDGNSLKKAVIHCEEGGFCLEKNGQFTVVPSLCLPSGFIKGAVGAGDAFCAACLYSIYSGFDSRAMLEFASAAAACNLTKEDSVSGMRGKDEIIALGKSLERRTLL